jgi:hypothetical protein
VRGLFLAFPTLSAACAVAACAGARPAPAPATAAAEESPSWRFLRERYDADRDGRIARAEYTRSAQGFARLDADGDGVVSAPDFDARWDGVPRIAAAAGEAGEGRWISFEDFVHGEGGPEVGDPAPPFRLAATDGAELELASFRDEKPVVLVFGSFT